MLFLTYRFFILLIIKILNGHERAASLLLLVCRRRLPACKAPSLHGATVNQATAGVLHVKPPPGTLPHGTLPAVAAEDVAQHAVTGLRLRSNRPAQEATTIA
jgi:hypothetical protein